MTLTASERGYDAEHRRKRRDWEPIVEAGGVTCWRCERAIEPGMPWDLGHDDLDRALYRGPEHRRCNRATKGRSPNAPASARTGGGGRLAERICEVCLGAYRPTYTEQRTCGRACGVELQRRSRPVKEKCKPTLSRVYFGTCELCSLPFTSRSPRRKYCDDACSAEANRQHARARARALRGGPTKACADCGITLDDLRRMKCDSCLRESKRTRRRRQRASARRRGAAWIKGK